MRAAGADGRTGAGRGCTVAARGCKAGNDWIPSAWTSRLVLSLSAAHCQCAVYIISRADHARQKQQPSALSVCKAHFNSALRHAPC